MEQTQLAVSLTRSAAVNTNQLLYTAKDERGLRINQGVILKTIMIFLFFLWKNTKRESCNTELFGRMTLGLLV